MTGQPPPPPLAAEHLPSLLGGHGFSDAETWTALAALHTRLQEQRRYHLGFPNATDLDVTALAALLGGQALNNVGDPADRGLVFNHSKDFELAVVEAVAGLLRAPQDGWGYVTGGASEGTIHALLQARTRWPDAIVYTSQAAHHSVAKAAHLLAMPLELIGTDGRGEVNYHELGSQLQLYQQHPAVVVASAGTSMTEAIDDVRTIAGLLKRHEVADRHIHVDAALSGLPLALTPWHQRPGFDFVDGADSVVISGHKFLGLPTPSAVLVHRRRPDGIAVPYTGCADTTLGCSRPGHTALMWWYALANFGVDGLRRRAEASRNLAAYTVRRLTALRWPAWRHPHARTVVLQTPPPPVSDKWVLPGAGGWSHLITMPGTSQVQIDEFVADLAAAAKRNPPAALPPLTAPR